MPESSPYVGRELELFEGATVWKAYVGDQLGPALRGRVLEVGAGIGATTVALYGQMCTTWTALEPDASLAGRLEARVAEHLPRAKVRVEVGTTADLEEEQAFDTIVYIDVLEHIEADREELERAARHLAPGGHLVVLAPAHQALFSEFDRAIGHHRRYDASSLRAVSPSHLDLVRVAYLDSVGLLASGGNRYLTRSATPRPGQIALWDKVMVRGSRVVDRLVGYRLGRSILAIWRRR